MSPDLLEEAIQDRIVKTGHKPKAIIVVDLYGMPAQWDKIEEIAKANKELAEVKFKFKTN